MSSHSLVICLVILGRMRGKKEITLPDSTNHLLYTAGLDDNSSYYVAMLKQIDLFGSSHSCPAAVDVEFTVYVFGMGAHGVLGYH